jgi:hypothetical protein
VALGVEALAAGADAPDAVAREDRLDLLQDSTQALGVRALVGPQAQRPVDAVDDLEPVARELIADLDAVTLDLAGGALAVVVEVGQRPLVALLGLGELLAQGVGVRSALLGLAFGAGSRVRALPGGVTRV